jgi:hypothetical protein
MFTVSMSAESEIREDDRFERGNTAPSRKTSSIGISHAIEYVYLGQTLQ